MMGWCLRSHPLAPLAIAAWMAAAGCAPSGEGETDDDTPDDDSRPVADDDSTPPEDDDTTPPPDDDASPADDDSGAADDDSAPDDDTTSDDDTAPLELDGRAYEVDLLLASWTPAALGTILSAYFDSVLLIGVQGHTATTIDMIGALGLETDAGALAQDPCVETLPLTDAVPGAFSPPEFDVGPADLGVDVSGVTLTITQAAIGGRFSYGYDHVADLRIEGEVDLSTFDVWLGGDGATCELAESLGIPCGDCLDGEAETCIEASAREMHAPLVPFGLIERTAEDIAADPGC